MWKEISQKAITAYGWVDWVELDRAGIGELFSSAIDAAGLRPLFDVKEDAQKWATKEVITSIRVKVTTHPSEADAI